MLTSLVATDVERMFAVLLPVFAIGCAAVVREFVDLRLWWAVVALAALTVSHFFLSLPNQWIELDRWLRVMPSVPVLKVGAVWLAAIALALRHRVTSAIADLRAAMPLSSPS